MRTLRKLIRCRKGGSAAEFAVIAMPLLLMLFGVSETARYYWTVASLQSAAQQTSRCMGVHQPSCGASGTYSASLSQAYLQSLASGDGVGLTPSQISLSNAATCGGATGFSQVTITYTFQTVVPLMMTSMAKGIPIKQTACFPNLS